MFVFLVFVFICCGTSNLLVNCPPFFVKVESLFEDEDFRMKVTREEFEELCQDLVDRIDKVIRDALTTAELSRVCYVLCYFIVVVFL